MTYLKNEERENGEKGEGTPRVRKNQERGAKKKKEEEEIRRVQLPDEGSRSSVCCI